MHASSDIGAGSATFGASVTESGRCGTAAEATAAESAAAPAGVGMAADNRSVQKIDTRGIKTVLFIRVSDVCSFATEPCQPRAKTRNWLTYSRKHSASSLRTVKKVYSAVKYLDASDLFPFENTNFIAPKTRNRLAGSRAIRFQAPSANTEIYGQRKRGNPARRR